MPIHSHSHMNSICLAHRYTHILSEILTYSLSHTFYHILSHSLVVCLSLSHSHHTLSYAFTLDMPFSFLFFYFLSHQTISFNTERLNHPISTAWHSAPFKVYAELMEKAFQCHDYGRQPVKLDSIITGAFRSCIMEFNGANGYSELFC